MIGVYAVINRKNHMAYVGSSGNVRRRLVAHRCAIKNKRFIHKEAYANDAMRHDFSDFTFKVLKQTTTIAEARQLETAFLECFLPFGLYNKAAHANGATGVRRNTDSYVKGAAKRNADPQYRVKLSVACKGKREIVICPHCQKNGGGGNMRRYHFSNCKK